MRFFGRQKSAKDSLEKFELSLLREALKRDRKRDKVTSVNIYTVDNKPIVDHNFLNNDRTNYTSHFLKDFWSPEFIIS